MASARLLILAVSFAMTPSACATSWPWAQEAPVEAPAEPEADPFAPQELVGPDGLPLRTAPVGPDVEVETLAPPEGAAAPAPPAPEPAPADDPEPPAFDENGMPISRILKTVPEAWTTEPD